jgi:hypothetical protein
MNYRCVVYSDYASGQTNQKFQPLFKIIISLSTVFYVVCLTVDLLPINRIHLIHSITITVLSLSKRRKFGCLNQHPDNSYTHFNYLTTSSIFMKLGTKNMLLEDSQNHKFLFPSLGSNNMADARNWKTGAILAPITLQCVMICNVRYCSNVQIF